MKSAELFIRCLKCDGHDHTAFRVDWMRFAGLLESGLGVGGIPHTLQDIQVEKMLAFRSREL